LDDQGQTHSYQEHHHHLQHHHHQQQHQQQRYQDGRQSQASGGDRWDFVGALGKVARMFFSARKGNPG
ncbi:hypothetical protein KR032_000578, partial [Drosophila birchii]